MRLVLFIAVVLLYLLGTTLGDYSWDIRGGVLKVAYKQQVVGMFEHAWAGYLRHAFPKDELRPISCSGVDTWGPYSVTLVDSLDTLVIMGKMEEFQKYVDWVENGLRDFDMDKEVSLFETNIRMLGGLLSAHYFALDYVPRYSGHLLELATDLGDRLIKAFDTPTGIPYGTINLKHGIPEGETTVSSIAAATTYSLEFGALSILTRNSSYANTAKKAVKAVWSFKTKKGLLGNHIDIKNGQFIHWDSSIGGSIDSFYEYLFKAGILFSDAEYISIFYDAYDAVMEHTKVGPWYVEVHPNSGGMTRPYYGTLQAYWPGMQAGMGELDDAIRTMDAFMSIWRSSGFSPEGYTLLQGKPAEGRLGYPLRPELAESLYHLYVATDRDPLYLEYAADIIYSIETFTKTECGFASVKNVTSGQLEDRMESFFLSETLKYLYLIFDYATDQDSVLHSRKEESYVFTTEGHPFPMSAMIKDRSYAVNDAKGVVLGNRKLNGEDVVDENNEKKAMSGWTVPSKGIALSRKGITFTPAPPPPPAKAVHEVVSIDSVLAIDEKDEEEEEEVINVASWDEQ